MNDLYVTKAFLPPQDEYEAYIQKIWDKGILTNQGPLLNQFEAEVKGYLGINSFHFVANGTLALQIALNGLDITEGEVITTPFSYVATVSSILWERCTPIFVDIELDSFCIDASKIEAAINSNTKAIMAVHVFGRPCSVHEIEAIAQKHNIKVIYDAAHSFGAKLNGKSLLDYGDVSVVSLHATKLFHTVEGGGIISPNDEVHEKFELTKRFGHHGDDHHKLGINAKASEFHAAMGLCNLKYVDDNIADRRRVSEQYDKLVSSRLSRPKTKTENFEYNYAYYPVVFESEEQLLTVKNELEKNRVFPRRYFYPSLNELPYLDSVQKCPVSENVSRTILCLPLFVGMTDEDIKRVADGINEVVGM